MLAFLAMCMDKAVWIEKLRGGSRWRRFFIPSDSLTDQKERNIMSIIHLEFFGLYDSKSG